MLTGINFIQANPLFPPCWGDQPIHIYSKGANWVDRTWRCSHARHGGRILWLFDIYLRIKAVFSFSKPDS